MQSCNRHQALPYRTVARWVGTFKKEENQLPICLAVDVLCQPTRMVAVVEQCLEEDRRWTVLELAQHTGIPASSVRLILRQDLNLRKISAKWVPHHLTEVQKWTRYEMCCINLEIFHREGNGMLNRIISIDETWARA